MIYVFLSYSAIPPDRYPLPHHCASSSLSAYSKPRAVFSRNTCRAWTGLDGVLLIG